VNEPLMLDESNLEDSIYILALIVSSGCTNSLANIDEQMLATPVKNKN